VQPSSITWVDISKIYHQTQNTDLSAPHCQRLRTPSILIDGAPLESSLYKANRKQGHKASGKLIQRWMEMSGNTIGTNKCKIDLSAYFRRARASAVYLILLAPTELGLHKHRIKKADNFLSDE
jgi:hypothetical protein